MSPLSRILLAVLSGSALFLPSAVIAAPFDDYRTALATACEVNGGLDAIPAGSPLQVLQTLSACAKRQALSPIADATVIERCVANGGLRAEVALASDEAALVKALDACARGETRAAAFVPAAPAAQGQRFAPTTTARAPAAPATVYIERSSNRRDRDEPRRSSDDRRPRPGPDTAEQKPMPPPPAPEPAPVADPLDRRLDSIQKAIDTGITQKAVTAVEAQVLATQLAEYKVARAAGGDTPEQRLALTQRLDALASTTNAALHNADGTPAPDVVAFAKIKAAKEAEAQRLAKAVKTVGATGQAPSVLEAAKNTTQGKTAPEVTALGVPTPGLPKPGVPGAGSAAPSPFVAKNPAADLAKLIAARPGQVAPIASAPVTTGTVGKPVMIAARPGPIAPVASTPVTSTTAKTPVIAGKVGTNKGSTNKPVSQRIVERQQVLQRAYKPQTPVRTVQAPRKTEKKPVPRVQARSETKDKPAPSKG